MEIVKNINLELIIRYGLSGFTALMTLIAFPCLVYNFKEYIKIFSDNLLFIISASFLTGYILDTLKLYNLTRGYKLRRDNFLKRLAEILNIRDTEATVYFSIMTQVSKANGIINLERRNAEWHYLDTTSKIFALSTIQWSVFLFLLMYNKIINFQINPYPGIHLLNIIITLLIAFRLNIISKKERAKIDKLFYKYAEINKDTLIKYIASKNDNTIL